MLYHTHEHPSDIVAYLDDRRLKDQVYIAYKILSLTVTQEWGVETGESGGVVHPLIMNWAKEDLHGEAANMEWVACYLKNLLKEYKDRAGTSHHLAPYSQDVIKFLTEKGIGGKFVHKPKSFLNLTPYKSIGTFCAYKAFLNLIWMEEHAKGLEIYKASKEFLDVA